MIIIILMAVQQFQDCVPSITNDQSTSVFDCLTYKASQQYGLNSVAWMNIVW